MITPKTFTQYTVKQVKQALNAHRTQHGNVMLADFINDPARPLGLGIMASQYARQAGCTDDTGIQQVIEAINDKLAAQRYQEAVR